MPTQTFVSIVFDLQDASGAAITVPLTIADLYDVAWPDGANRLTLRERVDTWCDRRWEPGKDQTLLRSFFGFPRPALYYHRDCRLVDSPRAEPELLQWMVEQKCDQAVWHRDGSGPHPVRGGFAEVFPKRKPPRTTSGEYVLQAAAVSVMVWAVLHTWLGWLPVTVLMLVLNVLAWQRWYPRHWRDPLHGWRHPQPSAVGRGQPVAGGTELFQQPSAGRSNIDCVDKNSREHF